MFQTSITARSPKARPPLINSHSFIQAQTNQKSRTVSNWLLTGLNLHEMMSINIIKSGNTFVLLAVIIVKITEKEKIMRKDIKKGKDLPLQEHTLDQ